MSVFHRANRAIVRFSGPEAEKLLNNVITAELKSVPGDVHWWALLSPQGKVQAEGLSAWHDDAFWLDVAATDVADFIKRMKLYRLRAKVEIEDMGETHALGWSESDPGGLSNRDPRHPTLGYRLIAPKSDATAWSKTDTFAARRIAVGLCEIGTDFPSNTYFPHDIGMDLLAGIDFSKGCYVGQEVVSRMQHRGTARRRPVLVTSVSGNAGDPVTIADREVGTLGQVIDQKAVALVRVDKVKDPADAEVAGAPVTLALPHWASYGFADSATSVDGD